MALSRHKIEGFMTFPFHMAFPWTPGRCCFSCIFLLAVSYWHLSGHQKCSVSLSMSLAECVLDGAAGQASG